MKHLAAAAVAVLCACAALTVPAKAFASGFALPEQSSSAMGMASAFVGQADDASAVWYNPAGLTQLKGTALSAGAIAIYPSLKHETVFGTTEVVERNIHVPVHLYGAGKAGDRLAFGIGINNPFGLSTTWSPASSTAGVATLSEIKTVNVNPNVAFKVGDRLSIGVGIDYVMLDATLSSALLKLTGDGDGWGGNASLLYAASDQVSIGFTYRSKTRIDVDGIAFEILPGATSITLPDIYKIGASIRTSDDLTINTDLEMTNWSTYNHIEIATLGIRDPKLWQDTWCLRVGGQYRLSEAWKLRAGYLYDQNPVREEFLETRIPDSDRQGITLGAGYTSGSMTIDAAYMFLRFNPRTVNNSIVDDLSPNPLSTSGTYRSTANLLGITVGYSF